MFITVNRKAENGWHANKEHRYLYKHDHSDVCCSIFTPYSLIHTCTLADLNTIHSPLGRCKCKYLSLTGTVRQSSTKRSFIYCLCWPLCRRFRPGEGVGAENRQSQLLQSTTSPLQFMIAWLCMHKRWLGMRQWQGYPTLQQVGEEGKKLLIELLVASWWREETSTYTYIDG